MMQEKMHIPFWWFVLAGVLVATGIRIAEWVIPAPEMRVIVCTMSDIGKIETCTGAAELLERTKRSQP